MRSSSLHVTLHDLCMAPPAKKKFDLQMLLHAVCDEACSWSTCPEVCEAAASVQGSG